MNIEPYPDDGAISGPDAPNADQIDDLIRLLVTIRHRFGNTAVRYGLSWGATALWARDDQRKQIVELEDQLEELVPGRPRALPQRCYELKLRVGGDTWPDVAAEFERLADSIRRQGPGVRSRSGGESSGSYVSVRHDPAMTHDKYFAALDEAASK